MLGLHLVMRGNNYGIIVLSNSRIIQLYSRKDEIKQANKTVQWHGTLQMRHSSSFEYQT